MKNKLVFKEITQLNIPYFNLQETLQALLKKGESTLWVFIDLSKAFDTVDHQISSKQLQHSGIDGTVLKWFKSCLVIKNSTYPPTIYLKIV